MDRSQFRKTHLDKVSCGQSCLYICIEYIRAIIYRRVCIRSGSSYMPAFLNSQPKLTFVRSLLIYAFCRQ